MINQLLEMIEAVDPNDTEKLDEIDARVEQYVRNTDYLPLAHKHYTKSRDALKAIRSNNLAYWMATVHTDGGFIVGYHCVLKFANDHFVESPYSQSTKPLLTEELAELHAILQAIDFERNTQ